MISRKPKLQRQRKIFKQQGKNVPRPTQLNINVATWGRLIKRSSQMPPPYTPGTPPTHQHQQSTSGPHISLNSQQSNILNNNAIQCEFVFMMLYYILHNENEIFTKLILKWLHELAAPPRPPKLDLSQIPSRADVILEMKTNEMRTFTTPDKPSVSVPTTPYMQVVTTPSEVEVCVSHF